jgi:uncharacterized protein
MDERLRRVHSVIVKLTNRCNIRCAYCYESIVSKGADMSLDTFRSLVSNVLDASAEREVLFVLHGGEPTLLPTEWFESALSFAFDAAERRNKVMKISIQTNLIKVSDKKLLLFRAHRVRLGGSLDNPDFIQESQRPMARQALATYWRAKELGVGVGIISTINGSNYAHMYDHCQWLHGTLGLNHFKANAAYSVGMGVNLPPLSPEDLWTGQSGILRYMLETEGDFVEDNLGYELIHYFENEVARRARSASLCGDKTCGAGRQVIGVTPSGELLPCGRFQWSDRDFYLGSVTTPADDAVGYEARVDRFHGLSPENWRDCGSCRAQTICGYGCQAFIVRSKRKINNECEPTQQRFDWYCANQERLRRLYERFCGWLDRPSMSAFEQKLHRLRMETPASEWMDVKNALSREIAGKLAGLS